MIETWRRQQKLFTKEAKTVPDKNDDSFASFSSDMKKKHR
jgi:hypothetical protein